MKLKVKKIARSKNDGYTISTVQCGDQYETAIKLHKGEYIVVEKYTEEHRARIGHRYWVEFCDSKPFWATDVNTKEQTLF